MVTVWQGSTTTSSKSVKFPKIGIIVPDYGVDKLYCVVEVDKSSASHLKNPYVATRVVIEITRLKKVHPLTPKKYN